MYKSLETDSHRQVTATFLPAADKQFGCSLSLPGASVTICVAVPDNSSQSRSVR